MTPYLQVWFGRLKWKLWDDILIKNENCGDWAVSLSFARPAGCSECKLLAMVQSIVGSLGDREALSTECSPILLICVSRQRGGG